MNSTTFENVRARRITRRRNRTIFYIKFYAKIALVVCSFILVNMFLFTSGQLEHPYTSVISRFFTSSFQTLLIFGLGGFLKYFFKNIFSDF